MPALHRCAQCNRPVAIRWRRCKWCKSWTGLPRNPSDPFVDRKLDGFRSFGLWIGVWTGLAAVVLGLEHPLRGALIGVFGLAIVIAHVLIVWHPVGWRAAEVLWGVAAVVLAITLRADVVAASMALFPLAALGLMLLYRSRALARLEGKPAGFEPRSAVPEPGPCAWCGRRETEIVAPLWCLSAGWLTWRFPGRLRNLCLWHARLAAAPAFLATALVGWWGIPWGLLWTPRVLFHDLETGGVIAGSRELSELRTEEATEGGSDLASGVGFLAGLAVVPLTMIAVLLPRLPALLR